MSLMLAGGVPVMSTPIMPVTKSENRIAMAEVGIAMAVVVGFSYHDVFAAVYSAIASWLF